MATKEKKMFYANKDKYQRAVALHASKKYKSVKMAYEAIGGTLSEGTGYKEV